MNLPITIEGVVIEGKREGAKNGFPTVNLALKQAIETGIYAGETFVRNQRYLSAIYVGKNPTLIESHLLDFKGDLYGQNLTLILRVKIRDDQHFNSKSDLRITIQKDIAVVRNLSLSGKALSTPASGEKV